MSDPIPLPGELLPDTWWDEYVIEWRDYDARSVPLNLQEAVQRGDRKDLLCVGEHPEHGLFLAEVLDNGNSPPYFRGWWKLLDPLMAPETPIATLDDHLEQILERPLMFAPTVAALESVVWTLLSLRGRLHPRPRGEYSTEVVRASYRELKAKYGAKGPQPASAYFEEAMPAVRCERRDSVPTKPLRFYLEWAALTRHRQDTTPAPAVHILEAGAPLCQFMDTLPGNWPPGHKWVLRATDNEGDATCEHCLQSLQSQESQT